MNLSPELCVLLVLLCASMTTLACSAARRGATAAPPVVLRRRIASATRPFRLRWLAMRSVAHDEIAGELHRATAGDAVLSPWLARFVLDALGGTASAEPGARTNPAVPLRADQLDPPTTGEREVLLLIASGYSYGEVATRLGLSVEVVETSVSRVLSTLAPTRSGAGSDRTS